MHLLTFLMKLTAQQQELLKYIEEYKQEKGTAPSQREIQKKFGFASRNAVPKHLAALEKKGLLHRSAGLARSMVLSQRSEAPSFLQIPILGAIPAGYAQSLEQEQEHSLAIDLKTLQLPPNAQTFALKVRGDSMIDAGIFDGDLVILERAVARSGEIVAALIDGESTLKRLVAQEGKSFLKAENSKYPDLLPVEELVIQGSFRALLRLNKSF